MIKFLRKNQQAFIGFILLYGLLAVASVYFTHSISDFHNSPFELPFLNDILIRALFGSGAYFLLSLFCLFILTLSALYLTRIAINSMIITRRSQYTALFYISISAFALKSDFFSGAYLASLFLILAMQRIISSIDLRKRSYHFLDAGLLLALGSIFYFNLIFLLPFLWISQLVLKQPSWKELSYTLIGLSLPFTYIIAAAFILDLSITDAWLKMKQWVFLQRTIELKGVFLYGVGYYALLILIGTIYALRKFTASKIQVRKLYQLLFFMFCNILGILLLIPSAGIEIFYLLATPVSILYAIYFSDCRSSLVNNLIFLLLLTAPILAIFID